MSLQKIAANTSQSMVADGLREAILSGALQEGQSLRQQEIANLFGLSRVPVRKALRQLEGEGLVTSHVHREVVVSTLSDDEIREITEMRVALGPLAIRTAMEHITNDDLRPAEKALDAIQRRRTSRQDGQNETGISTPVSTRLQDGHASWHHSRPNTGTSIASYACTSI